jgi:hypothetical protein
MQETVLGSFNSFPAGERLSEVGQQRSSVACNRIYRSTIVNNHLLPFDQAMIYQPLKPMIKRPLGTLQIFQPQKLEQLDTRDESGPQDLLQLRYVSSRVDANRAFFVTHGLIDSG